MEEIPVYLFTGFLDAGKTRFIQETLEDERFNSGEKTLLLLCEEGEEEYSPDSFSGKNIHIKNVERSEDITPENLTAWLGECEAERVVVEYNGMWMLDDLYRNLPEGWAVYQEMMFADANTFIVYNSNMRSLIADKLKSCELIVLNRTKPAVDRQEIHKIIRGLSRRADIAYELENGEVEYDDIEDPLPFDINAPVIEVDDDSYALWYRDLSEEMDKYEGKTVRVKGMAVKEEELPAGSFIFGRQIMTCCAEDITLAGLLCKWPGAGKISDKSWISLTAKIKISYEKAYGRKGPVLKAVSIEPAEAPEEEVATFY